VLNLVIVIGRLAKETQVRQLPSGLSFASFDLLVPRPDQPADTVPVALFDAPASMAGWPAGHEVMVVGRVRRRFFRVAGATQSRTEVVAEQVVQLTRKDDVRVALAGVGERLVGVTAEL
jgi:single-strand DNA-binding protein